ncbi:MAG: protein-disulfide reductase DsbD, partial [Candidatus Competibacteraceae bacterium]|nr:protein-disulfide reductase DsbD [Candidatus Competibacteraceae bacterium]
IRVGYQGCAEVGVCYPPQQEIVPVALPVLVAAQPPEVPPALPTPPAAEQDLISRMLLEQRFLALPAFFGFGLLLAFTPCVFPMIPILSGLIAGQGESLTQWRAFSLSLVYVLAMAVTYTFAGVLAGLLGANIQIWFQDPWVLAIFSALFVALALSMFGLFELQLPTRWQSRMAELSNRQSGGSFLGVGMMGLLSALIVGPCVAPPLIGILTVIAASGDVFLGGTALFAMSLGMGAPLVLIGTSAGRLLPRAGHWMERVKAIFGVLLLGVAIWMLERILPDGVIMLAWAILAIVSATFMGALQSIEGGAPGWRVLVKGLGVVLLAYGMLLLVGMAAGGRDPLQPLQGTFLARREASLTDQLAFQPVKGPAGLDQALTAAGGPVMLDFYADWCVSCKELERYTFSAPQVRAELKNFRLLQTDVTANDPADQALLQRFGLIGPPAILFFDAQGRELPTWRVVGFIPADRFRDHLQGVMSL